LTDLILKQADGITLLRFNRPERLNAFSRPMYRALEESIASFGADDAQRALILTGVGRAFCSGQDLDEIRVMGRQDRESVSENVEQLQQITRRMRSIYKPFIAAVNGPAVGFGAELTLACDMRIAARNAYFMFPELERGLFFTNAATSLLPQLIGATRAARLFLTGERMSADEALHAGLVSQVTSQEELESAALSLARQMSERRPESIRLAIEGLRLSQGPAVEAAMQFETAACVSLMRGNSLQDQKG
jgi:enoyl-CoA hydratase/carnithine racemase